MNNKNLRNVGTLLLLAVFGGSLIANYLQGTRLLALEETLNGRVAQVAEGSRVPDLAVQDVSGHPYTISVHSPLSTVLYVLRPTCIWCERNSEKVNALASDLHGKYQVVGLALTSTGLDEFMDKHHINFPVYTGISSSLRGVYHLNETPQTILVSPEGRVVKVWSGDYSGYRVTDMYRQFGLNFANSGLSTLKALLP